nr:BamA/TamA family outer membrane protein [Acanthopleuribacter pedis]
MVRLETQGEHAKLFLRERNRYSAGLEVNYDERNKAGYAIQFSDNMFLKRLDRFSMRAEHNNRIDDLLTQVRLRRLWWLPVDFQLSGRWTDNKEPIFTQVEDDDFFGQRRRSQQFETITEGSLEAIYKLTETQEVSAGVRMRRSTLNDISEVFGPDDEGKPNSDPANLLLSTENEFAVDALPINLTWVYRTLDNPTKPRSGLLLSLAVEHSIDGFGTDEAVEGTRWLGKMSRFQSWNKWLWTHRLESGIYRRTQDLEVSGGGTGSGSEVDTVFFLGGSTTMRGFDQEFAGPIGKELSATLDEDGVTILSPPTFRGLGGDAMFFMSEELTYHTNWYWIEVAGFVDTGWVWNKYDEMFDFSPAVTGGFGLGIDSPIGYFRFDWARPIYDDALQRVLDDSTNITPDDQEFARERALQEFTFRFGRTF